MTCHKIAGAIVCTADSFFSLEPFGAKVWCEYHSWLGPSFYRSEKAIKVIEHPSRKTWRAYEAWQAWKAQLPKLAPAAAASPAAGSRTAADPSSSDAA